MRNDTRPYYVCKKCKQSWVWCHRAAVVGNCTNCGATWPTYRKPQTDQRNNNTRVEEWKPPRQKSRRSAAQTALRTVWEHLPAQAQTAIESAGWSPPALPSPPGLAAEPMPAKIKPVNSGGGGKGKGKGKPQRASQVPEQDLEELMEATRALFATASDNQIELLQKIGFVEPPEPTPDLTELLKKHLSQLPPAVRAAVEEPPPEPPTPQEQLTDTSRKYKDATTELRTLITRKSALQHKIDKHKATFNELLRDMQTLDETLKVKQEQVATLQAELQTSVKAAAMPEGGSSLEDEFFKYLSQQTEEKQQDLKDRLFLSFEDASKRRRTHDNDEDTKATGPPTAATHDNDEDMKAAGPPTVKDVAAHAAPGTEAAERSRRSRSRGRVDQG